MMAWKSLESIYVLRMIYLCCYSYLILGINNNRLLVSA